MDNRVEIRIVPFSELQPLMCLRKEHVDLKPGSKTCYACAYWMGQAVGVVGWQMVGSTLRYKSGGVLPKYRGLGIYTMLFSFRERLCSTMPYAKVSAYCTSKSLPTFIKNGFKAVKTLPNGITIVERKKERNFPPNGLQN